MKPACWSGMRFRSGTMPTAGQRKQPSGEWTRFARKWKRDWNHPSIVIQSIMNEQWGMDPAQADQRAWLLNSFRDFKQLTAPLGRLITDNSACCKGFHLQSDFRRFSHVLLHP